MLACLPIPILNSLPKIFLETCSYDLAGLISLSSSLPSRTTSGGNSLTS